MKQPTNLRSGRSNSHVICLSNRSTRRQSALPELIHPCNKVRAVQFHESLHVYSCDHAFYPRLSCKCDNGRVMNLTSCTNSDSSNTTDPYYTLGIKVKLSLSLIKQTRYEDVHGSGLQLLVFSTSSLDRGKWSASSSGHSFPGGRI
jgi:hypothetical protein